MRIAPLSPLSPLAARTRRVLEEDAGISPSDRLLVAVSGGADSMALLGVVHEIATRCSWTLPVAAHLDHGWRGAAAAARDRDAVRRLCAAAGVALHHRGPPSERVTSEDRARRWRYTVLARLAAETGSRAVLTGHHRRDQAETVLLRRARHSGRRGLAGMAVTRPLDGTGRRVVRPLLGESPEALRAWLRARDIRWVEDATNDDATRDRARVRRALSGEPPDVEARLAACAARVGERLRAREHEARRRLDGALCVHPAAGAVEADRAALLRLGPRLVEPALRVLGARLHADRDGPWLTRAHVARCRALLLEGGAHDLPRGLAFSVGRRRVFLRRRADEGADALPPLHVRRSARAAFDLEGFLGRRSPFEVALDLARVGARPRLRRARPGDRFVPHGHPSNGERTLAHWLAAQGAPRWLRERVLVVEGREGLVWVVGWREAAGTHVGAHTEAVVHLAVHPRAEADPPQAP